MLDHFPVMLLDLNNTFMFHGDRFGPSDDFHPTYQSLGGLRLDALELNRIVRTVHQSMFADYANPAKQDDFPQVCDVLRLVAPHLADEDVDQLDQVFTLHELGHVSDDYAAVLQRLSTKHRLGLVSNLWCKKQPWLNELQRANVLHLFESVVISSDHKHIKPSPALFNLALAPFGVERSQVVFVGDSLRCDVIGAKRAGMATVWINPERETHPDADFVVGDLLEL